MEPRPLQMPVLVYATLVGVVALLMIWQHGKLSAKEDAVRKADAVLTSPQSLEFSQLEKAEEEQQRQTMQLLGAYSQARSILKLSFLGLIVFPTAVLFPLLLSGAPSKPKGKPKRVVKKVQDLTFDDVDQGWPVESASDADMDAKSRLFIWNGIAFAAPTLLVLFFVLSKPTAYAGMFGGLQTLMLFVVGTLITFSATGMATPWREQKLETQQIATRLAAGYVVLAGLAWWLL